MKCDDRPVCEIFDKTIGTSTGGIIAILLGRCGYTIQQCISICEELSQTIFGASRIEKRFRYWLTNSRFDAERFEAAMEKVIGDCFGDCSLRVLNLPVKCEFHITLGLTTIADAERIVQ